MKQNLLTRSVRLALAGAVAGSLVACGGSGSGSSPASANGSSVGPISGFGSVYVNGTRFRTDGSVRSDDGIEREGQLEKGMIVRIQGDWDDQGEGDARGIDYDDTLRGLLDSATWNETESSGELQVAGQTVLLDDQTVFKGAAPADLAAASSGEYRVRVSAWRLDDGRFRASFVGAVSASARFDDLYDTEIEGVVADLDTQAQTFTLNGLTVEYVSAEFDDDFSADLLENGMVVEVEGRIENGVLVAEEIDDEDDWFDDGEDLEISGAIQGAYDSDTRQFRLNGLVVQVGGDTEFDDMIESDLAEGLLVKVEGEMRNGVLVAEEVERRDADAELEASIGEINGSERSMLVGGVRVTVTDSTLIEDDDRDDGDRIGFDDLRVGDYLEVEGVQRGEDGGYLEAVKIERDDDDDDGFELEARVDVVADGSVTVAGLEFSTVGLAVTGLRIGDEVEIEYVQDAGGQFRITELELDDDDD